MRFRLFGVRDIVAMLIVIAMGAATGVFFHSHGTERMFVADIAAVKACQGEKNQVICSSPFVRHILTYETVSETMDSIAKELPGIQCHFEGHVVGQQLYMKSGSVESALEQCNRQCDSSCVHGVIGEAFAEELGYGNPTESKDVDLSHLSKAQIIKLGGALCGSIETCHGVGHVIFQAEKNIGAGMALCDSFASREDRIVPCYNGVTMEYSDILTSKNVRNTSDIVPPPASSLRSLCLFSSIDKRHACFRYLGRYAVATLLSLGYSESDALTKIRLICESFPPGDDRVSCMTGIGMYENSSTITNPSEARRVCDASEKLQDKAACVLGEVFTGAAYREKTLAEYCSSFKNEVLEQSCYQDLFHYLFIAHGDMGAARGLCVAGNVACTTGLGNYKLDSRAEILKL